MVFPVSFVHPPWDVRVPRCYLASIVAACAAGWLPSTRCVTDAVQCTQHLSLPKLPLNAPPSITLQNHCIVHALDLATYGVHVSVTPLW